MQSVLQNYTRVQVIDVSSTDMVCGDGTAQFPHANAFLISTAGNLVIDTLGGDTGVIVPVPVGEVRIGATKVHKTGTTAAGTALY